MSIFAICGAAVITAVSALLLRPRSPQSALLLSIAAGVIVILSLIRNLPDIIGGVNELLTAGGIDSGDLSVLFKVMGICFLTEFTCDCVTEAGLLSLSTNISFAGKILVLITALPLFSRIVDVIRALGE